MYSGTLRLIGVWLHYCPSLAVGSIIPPPFELLILELRTLRGGFWLALFTAKEMIWKDSPRHTFLLIWVMRLWEDVSPCGPGNQWIKPFGVTMLPPLQLRVGMECSRDQFFFSQSYPSLFRALQGRCLAWPLWQFFTCNRLIWNIFSWFLTMGRALENMFLFFKDPLGGW